MSKNVGKRKANEDSPKKSFPLGFDVEEMFARMDQRKRDAIANSSFRKQNTSDMMRPYYRVVIHLVYEETQPPETYHATALEAAQAMWDFFMGDYGYGQDSYYVDSPSWWGKEFFTPESRVGDPSEWQLQGVPEMADMIETAISTTSKYKVSSFTYKNNGKERVENYLEITRVDEEE